MKTRILKRENICEGDIILSVGTSHPNLSIEKIKADFDEYSEGAYERLIPLRRPLIAMQSLMPSNGHSDTVHAGVCIGINENGEPLITDLHGHVQEIPVSKYYKPCTLIIYRPNLPSEFFKDAREQLLVNAPKNERETWEKLKKSYYGALHQFYLPGRINTKWDVSLETARLVLPSINFFPSTKPVNVLSSQLTCGKLVIQVYKILLRQIEDNFQLNDSCIKNYMGLSSNSTPKALEDYLVNNVNFEKFVAPYDNNLFQSLFDKVKEHPLLLSIYKTIEKEHGNEDPYLKSNIFLQQCEKFNVPLPDQVIELLASQAIKFDERDKQKELDYAITMQYKYGKKILTTMVDKLTMHKNEGIASLIGLDQNIHDLLLSKYTQLKSRMKNKNTLDKIENIATLITEQQKLTTYIEDTITEQQKLTTYIEDTITEQQELVYYIESIKTLIKFINEYRKTNNPYELKTLPLLLNQLESDLKESNQYSIELTQRLENIFTMEPNQIQSDSINDNNSNKNLKNSLSKAIMWAYLKYNENRLNNQEIQIEKYKYLITVRKELTTQITKHHTLIESMIETINSHTHKLNSYQRGIDSPDNAVAHNDCYYYEPAHYIHSGF